MFTKSAQRVAQVFSLVFTSVVAPVVVSVVVHDLNGDDGAKLPGAAVHGSIEGSPPAAAPPAAGMSAGHVTVEPAAFISITIQGTGHSADEAFQQALRAALYKLIVAEFGADCWTQRGPAICAEAWGNVGGIVRSWQTLSVTTASQRTGPVYSVTAAVEIDRRSLLARLCA